MSQPTEQKFKRGDVVQIAKDLGPYMPHFRADTEAIVMGSYRDKYGGGPENMILYTVMFRDNGHECSWYNEPQLTLLHHGGQEEIDRVLAAKQERNKYETDLNWIVTNWKDIRTGAPSATMFELMRLIGIKEPWGLRGEGVTLHCNMMGTFMLLDPVLQSGDIKEVEAFLGACRVPSEARKEP